MAPTPGRPARPTKTNPPPHTTRPQTRTPPPPRGGPAAPRHRPPATPTPGTQRKRVSSRSAGEDLAPHDAAGEDRSVQEDACGAESVKCRDVVAHRGCMRHERRWPAQELRLSHEGHGDHIEEGHEHEESGYSEQ